MKIIKNEKLIERNGKIGQWMSLASLIVLGLGLYISFTVPEYFIYSIVCLVIGFTMTQISIYMGNRWGRSPRADEKFDAGLKGLHSDFVIYHFSSPVSHLLIGPSGAWVLHPLHQRGKISYQKNRWKLSNGGFLQAYMSVFGQEGLGRPEIDAENEVQALRKFLTKKMDESTIPEIKPILVFTNDEIEVDAGDSPIAAMRLKQLKEFMRQGGKNRSLSNEQIKALSDALES
ncbi:MAG TPA: hypothetical protein PKE48_18110 [Anaerolineales bacterium]|nr:hypothetical protein [Anaerolineales bacterium]